MTKSKKEPGSLFVPSGRMGIEEGPVVQGAVQPPQPAAPEPPPVLPMAPAPVQISPAKIAKIMRDMEGLAAIDAHHNRKYNKRSELDDGRDDAFMKQLRKEARR